MPLLKPVPLSDSVSNVLSASGLSSSREIKTGDALKKALNKYGLGLEDCVQELAAQLLGASKEETKRGLLETALKMNGAMKEDSVREAPSIVFQIQSENVNLMNLFAPQRD